MSEPPRAIVVGGSLGGLTAALLLREVGCVVDVYERSRTPLAGRGAGIVAHPATMRYAVENGLVDIASTTTPARWVRYLDRDGATISEREFHYRFTSYFALHRDLLGAFGNSNYHLGKEVVDFDQDATAVAVEFADGQRKRCEVLVCADGIRSTARRLLLPQVEREYAGYVAWRGAVAEADLPPEIFQLVDEAIVYAVMPNSHILAYPIPGPDGSVARGRRFLNWIWYRNVAGDDLATLMTDVSGTAHEISLGPGLVRADAIDSLRIDSERLVAPPLAEMIARTAEPFVQVVFDVEVLRLAFGRICLIGDAACVLRPHVAVGTAKAAAAAWTMAEAIADADFDVPAALAAWEPDQLAVEHGALARARATGIRSQFENTWEPGEPLPFGLHRTGDSSIPV
jgi:2,6-dihydroxypyridine 3-monooxygenase